MPRYLIDDYLDVLAAFGIDPSSCWSESLYAYGPVFVSCHGQRDVVIKRTRSPLPRARALHRWAASLYSGGVPLVTPDPDFRPNPIQVGDDVWVIYPFIRGDTYVGAQAEVHAAGELLGLIHGAEVSGSALDFASFTWPQEDAQSSLSDFRFLAEVLEARRVSQADDLLARYRGRMATFYAEVVPALRSANLVWRRGPWDFKANNLIYTDSNLPTLVDPDSAGFLPRILDLALAALLFHNELSSAPGRMFDGSEWKAFLSGYARHVTLTAAERELWPAALEFMHLEEGLWLMLHDAEGWEDPHQGSFLRDLLESDLEQLASI